MTTKKVSLIEARRTKFLWASMKIQEFTQFLDNLKALSRLPFISLFSFISSNQLIDALQKAIDAPGAER
jgi:hypothetical protein